MFNNWKKFIFEYFKILILFLCIVFLIYEILIVFYEYSYNKNSETSNNQAINIYNAGRENESFQIWLELAKNGNKMALNSLNEKIFQEKFQNVDFDLLLKVLNFLSNNNIKFSHSKKNYSYNKQAANFQIGLIYFNGEKINKNYSKAIYYFKLSAAQDFEKAQFMLGYMYGEGLGVPTDKILSFDWIKRTAYRGYAPAQLALGKHYCQGIGVDKNCTTGLIWIKKAANKGIAEAQLELGKIYLEGLLAKPGHELAKKWLTLASDQGNHEAQSILNQFDKPQ